MEFFFGLFTQSRSSINTGFLERPITVGLIAALLTGQWTQCVGVGIFFELLWLDLFPAGTYLPPQRILSTLLVCCVLSVLSLTWPSLVVIPILCALPAASLGTFLEKRLRLVQSENHTRLVDWAGQSSSVSFPAFMIWTSLGKKIVVESGLFLVLAVLVTSFTAAFQSVLSTAQPPWDVRWPHLWTVALLGAILSVRIRKAYHILLASVVLGILAVLALV
ncbi:MAG: PTS sugar transporter subunit IIC [Thermodesulfobacteriota bacterium]